jgi:hypothetical protein
MAQEEKTPGVEGGPPSEAQVPQETGQRIRTPKERTKTEKRLPKGEERRRKPVREPLKPASPADPDLFVKRGDTWKLAVRAIITPPVAAEALRDRLRPSADDLRELGADTAPGELPDDLLVTAACTGALTHAAFLDVLDGGCLVPAVCLCCYTAVSHAKAREAAGAIQAFRRYYNAGSYVKSRAYVRTVAALARDLRPEELTELKNEIYHCAEAGYGAAAGEPAWVREANAGMPGLCLAAPPCQPGVLWVYSTLDGRRLLRHLARWAPKSGAPAPVRVTVASSDAACSPKRRYRMYAAALSGTAPKADTQNSTVLLEEAVAWVRRGGHPVNAPKKSSIPAAIPSGIPAGIPAAIPSAIPSGSPALTGPAPRRGRPPYSTRRSTNGTLRAGREPVRPCCGES